MSRINHQPDKDCPLCPRLCGFRSDNKIKFPAYHNAPVPSFGALDAEFLVVGLAPGLHGANQTGRPFTGDYAGLILYSALLKAGFARGEYKERADDGMQLVNARITNAVRCVPQENKPETSEIKNCNNFLKHEIAAMPNLEVILSLGLVSHQAVLTACGLKKSAFKFVHGEVNEISVSGRKIKHISSYHTSRYNINVGTLTQHMFDEIIHTVRGLIES
jgi:uracil-DNA glycosylase family 4